MRIYVHVILQKQMVADNITGKYWNLFVNCTAINNYYFKIINEMTHNLSSLKRTYMVLSQSNIQRQNYSGASTSIRKTWFSNIALFLFMQYTLWYRSSCMSKLIVLIKK